MNNVFQFCSIPPPQVVQATVEIGNVCNEDHIGKELNLELPIDPFFSSLPTTSSTTAPTQTALHCAISNDKESMVRLLIEHGADVMRPDGQGKTALHLAAERGSEGLMRLIIDASPAADPNVTDYLGRTPLFYAVQCGNEVAVKVLLTRADINWKDRMGMTPLHLAAEYGYEAIARLLLANGADIHA